VQHAREWVVPVLAFRETPAIAFALLAMSRSLKQQYYYWMAVWTTSLRYRRQLPAGREASAITARVARSIYEARYTKAVKSVQYGRWRSTFSISRGEWNFVRCEAARFGLSQPRNKAYPGGCRPAMNGRNKYVQTIKRIDSATAGSRGRSTVPADMEVQHQHSLV
jgi:hypothetical protein